MSFEPHRGDPVSTSANEDQSPTKLGAGDLTLVQRANSAIIRWRCDGTIAFFNEYAQRFFGYSEAEAVGRPVSMLVPDRESSGADLTGLVQDIVDHPERYVSHVNENVCRDGRRVWMTWTNRAVLDDQGRVIEILAIGNDITERKQAEEELHRLAQFPGENPNPVLRIAADGTLLYANGAAGAWFKDFNWPPQGPVPEPVSALVTATRDAGHPVEGDFQTSDGRWWSVSAVQPRGETYVNLYGRDVTSRNQAEETLRRNEAELRGQKDLLAVTLASIGDAVMVTDTAGSVTFLNAEAERLTGWCVAEAVGQPLASVFRIVNEMTREPVESPVDKVLRLGCVVGLANHTILIAKDGRETPIDDSGAPVQAADGLVHGVVLVFRDITGRQAAERDRSQLSQHRQIALDAARLGWWHYDPVSKVSSYDRRFTEIFGISGAERPNGEILAKLHPDDLPQVWANVEAALDPASPQRYSAEYRIIRDDGSLRWIEAHGVASFEGRGQARRAIRLVGTVQDITERKQADESQARMIRHFELLADSAERLLASAEPQREVESLCLSLMDHLDCQFFFNYLNDPAAARLRLNACGGVADAVKRQIAWLDYGTAVCGCVARDRNRIVAERVQDRTDPRTALVADLGVRAYACHPLLGPGGAVIGTLSFGTRTRDSFSEQDLGLMKAVTNQVAVAMSRIAQERALRDGEERLRLAASAGRMGTWDWHVDTDRVEWSEGHFTLLGYAPGSVEPSYEWFEKRIHPDDLAAQQCEAAESMQQHREYHCEYRVIWPDGSVHWIEARGRYVYNESGAAVRMFGVVMDIDERKQLEERRLALLEAERAARMESEKHVRLKDEFLATISHELRSPLNAITGWTALLASGRIETDKAAGIIKRSAATLTQIVEDLLDMSRINSGKVRLNIEPVSASEIVSKALEAVQFVAQAKSVEIGVSFDPDLPPLRCDPNRIQQVVWNLLSNAVKFTPEGGQVKLDIRQDVSDTTITVSDNGQGMSPEFLPHLFEQFRQEDGSIARKHGGLGLGLSIVRRLVELHGGNVEGHSDGPGKGATFTVRLPRGRSAWFAGPGVAGVRPVDLSAALDERMLAGVRVLAVDDDPFTLELLDRVLSDAGATVYTADSGQRGLELLNMLRPDVLISDVGMPGEDGFGFIRKVRAAGDWQAELPALAATALARPEDRDLVKAAGFNDHMSKPFDPGRLCMAVRDLATRRPA